MTVAIYDAKHSGEPGDVLLASLAIPRPSSLLDGIQHLRGTGKRDGAHTKHDVLRHQWPTASTGASLQHTRERAGAGERGPRTRQTGWTIADSRHDAKLSDTAAWARRKRAAHMITGQRKYGKNRQSTEHRGGRADHVRPGRGQDLRDRRRHRGKRSQFSTEAVTIDDVGSGTPEPSNSTSAGRRKDAECAAHATALDNRRVHL